MENEKGETAVLFTTGTYSVTTAKHIRVVANACNHLNVIYCRDPKATEHMYNFNGWTRSIESVAANLLKAKKPEIYLNQMDVLFAQAQRYAEFYGLELPVNLIAAHAITSKAEMAQYKEAKGKEATEREAARLKTQAKEHKKQLQAWRNFETSHTATRLDQDYLRYNSDKKRIETSQHVEIPEAIAHKFYQRIKEVGTCVNCPDKLMDYNVKEINPQFVQVGCHHVKMAEINRIAKLLNW